MGLPVITVQPQSLTKLYTEAAAFNVTATSDNGALQYQWYKNGVALQDGGDGYGGTLSGSTSATLAFSSVGPNSAGTYFCRVRNNATGHVDTVQVTLTIGSDFPVITLQPESVVAALGSSAAFSCQAQSVNGGTLYYQWYKIVGGASGVITGASASTYTIDAVTADSVGQYFCLVGNTPFVDTGGWGTGTAIVALSLPAGTNPGAGGSTGAPTTGGGPVYTGGDGTTPPPASGGGTGLFASIGASASMSAWQGIARVAAAGNGRRWLRDGNFSTPRPCGPPIPELPFAQFGDRVTMIWKQRWRVAIESWVAEPPYAVHPDRSDFYLIKETLPEHRGAGIVEWERWYAPIPQAHYEEEVFPFSFQYLASTQSLGNLTRSVTSRIKHEFFLERDEAAFPALDKDEIVVVPTTVINSAAQGGTNTALKTGDLDLHLPSGKAFFVSSDPYIVAEPSKISVWNHPIKCRATRYVPGPTLASLGKLYINGNATPLPS